MDVPESSTAATAPPTTIRPGERVVAISAVTEDAIEIFGHGTYHHTEAPESMVAGIAAAIGRADEVHVDYDGMLDTLSRHMSPDRATAFRAHFIGREQSRLARPLSERARQVAAGVHHHRQVRLDDGTVIGADRCWIMSLVAFNRYALGTVVVTVDPRTAG